MLWCKSWLETRYRVVLMVGMTVVMLAMQHSSIESMWTKRDAHGVVLGLTYFLELYPLVTFLVFGGAGITTQTMRATKGLHGSMQYTLALPASRLRMLAVRAGIGWVEGAGIIGAVCCVLWRLYPAMRTVGTPREMVEYAGTLIACASCAYFLSVLLATFLDDQGRAFVSMFVVLVMWWLAVRGQQFPVAVDIFRAMGKASPLLTHTVSWEPIWFSIGLSVVLFVAALQVARLREY